MGHLFRYRKDFMTMTRILNLMHFKKVKVFEKVHKLSLMKITLSLKGVSIKREN